MSQKKLPQLRILTGTPCGADWDAMSGDSRVRRCQHCDRNVYNVAEMTSQEVQELIRSTEKRVCGKVFRRPDGTAVTRDCHDKPAQAKRVRFSITSLIVLVTASAILFALFPIFKNTIGPWITSWLPNARGERVPGNQFLDDFVGEIEMVQPSTLEDSPSMPEREPKRSLGSQDLAAE